MSPKQKKLAAKAPPPNKLDEKDFKVLREEKAKGRGMGLQDESVQPGKVMKAKRGKLGEAKDYKKYLKGLKKATSEVRGAKLNSPAYNITTYDQKSYERAGGKGKAVFKDYKGLGIKNEDQYFKEKNASKFMKRRKALSGAKSLIGKGGRIGAAITGLTIAGAGAAKLGQTIGKKIDEMKKKNKKMGGGMIKARVGKSIKTGKISDMSFDEKMKRVESGQINKKTGRFTSMNAMRDAKGFQKGETASDFNKRRMKLERAAKVAKSTRLGKILLPIVGAGVAAKTYLDSKMNKKKDVKKKMGGGMMQKPIGYKSGMGPAGAAGPSAGRPGGRRPMQQGPKGGIGSMPKKRDGIEIIVMTKDGPKRITRSELDGMSAIEQKMGGGMMKKPMGYRSGGHYDDKNKNVVKHIRVKKKMGGGMIAPSQRPGYSKGTMVKARGCKLGRTRPTKIT